MPISFDTYKGCTHGCKYCFAMKKSDITNVRPDNCLKAIERFANGKRTRETEWCAWPIPLHWGGLSDPFQPAEKEYRVSLNVLKLLAEKKYPFVVSTKGAIVAEPEYLDLIRQCNCVVQISASCPAHDKLEPGATSFDKRMEMLEKVSSIAKRTIVRIQPYFPETLQSVLQSIEKMKNAGAYGVTIEGMKFTKAQKGLVKVGADFCFPKGRLESDFEKIREKCHSIGLRFFCAENRLRAMGDDMCCCGVEGLKGFAPNGFNLPHLLNGDFQKPSPAMLKIGSAQCFSGLFQEAGSREWLDNNSFSSMMLSEKIFLSEGLAIMGDSKSFVSPADCVRVAKWMKSKGVTASDVNVATGTQMASHFLCTNPDGQCALPSPTQFEAICKHRGIKEIPPEIFFLVRQDRRQDDNVRAMRERQKRIFKAWGLV